jgi:CBS domain-containing protein
MRHESRRRDGFCRH